METDSMLRQFEQVEMTVSLQEWHDRLDVAMLIEGHQLAHRGRQPEVNRSLFAAKERHGLLRVGPEARLIDEPGQGRQQAIGLLVIDQTAYETAGLTDQILQL